MQNQPILGGFFFFFFVMEMNWTYESQSNSYIKETVDKLKPTNGSLIVEIRMNIMRSQAQSHLNGKQRNSIISPNHWPKTIVADSTHLYMRKKWLNEENKIGCRLGRGAWFHQESNFSYRFYFSLLFLTRPITVNLKPVEKFEAADEYQVQNKYTIFVIFLSKQIFIRCSYERHSEQRRWSEGWRWR